MLLVLHATNSAGSTAEKAGRDTATRRLAGLSPHKEHNCMFGSLTAKKPTKLRILLLLGYAGSLACYTKQFEQSS